MEIALREIEQAAERIRPLLHRTETSLSATFSAMTGGEVWLKYENQQKTGSFKLRGAGNKLACMLERGEGRPVVASSAGNHAQGVAYAARRLGLPATIVMPKAASIAKVQATEGYGARVVLAGDCYDDAYACARRICEAEGAAFLHPYNDPEVIAGQGTLGLELLEALPDVDAILVPAGGGGLLAGVAAAVKQKNPAVRVYGVQAAGADAIAQSFRAKRRICTDTVSTIADGIAVKQPGDITVPLISRWADDVFTVSDSEIANAILLLLERCKQMAEPAGAAALAAVLSGRLDVRGKRVCCLLSGGNIDVSFIQTIIERGLVARHRRIQFTATLVDRPGSLVRLLNIIAGAGANILKVEHDKLNAALGPNETAVHVACEVGGEAHGLQLVEQVRAGGFAVVPESV